MQIRIYTKVVGKMINAVEKVFIIMSLLGTYENFNGSYYKGEWKNDKKNGKGIESKINK